MKKLLLVLLAVALVGSVASAQMMAKTGQWGVQTSIGVATSPVLKTSTIGAKFIVSDQVGIRVEAGLTSFSVSGGAGSTTGYAIGAGFEYHLTGGKGNVSPYLGLQAGFGGGSVPTPAGGVAPTTSSTFGIVGVFGGEYFFSSNFSWAGELGIGFASTSNFVGTNSASLFATGSVTNIFTWYIN